MRAGGHCRVRQPAYLTAPSRRRDGFGNFGETGRRLGDRVGAIATKGLRGDPYGNRTRVSAVKGPRPNR